MSPTEKLIENIIDIVHATRNTPDDEKLAHLVKLLLATLKTHYAIGRWVSVEERLPVIDSSGKWAGYTKDLGGVMAFGYYDYHDLCVFYSAWLELDLLSGKEDAE